ncbi:hypothetical protein WA026_001133 [Henosepilachna vigintioctopunctata]|uniref:Uncharacterized protein n=1 Tax=Henosepilachna vigintioctopunctata TaxID=420089 RepID=A0AAW1UZU5_9CUCU
MFVNIVCKGVNNNTDLKKNKIKGAIKKRWMYLGRVSGNEVSESDILAYMDNIPNFETIDIKKLPTKGSNSAYSIGCPSEEIYNDISKPDFWPSGVVLREFNFRNSFCPVKKTESVK